MRIRLQLPDRQQQRRLLNLEKRILEINALNYEAKRRKENGVVSVNEGQKEASKVKCNKKFKIIIL